MEIISDEIESIFDKLEKKEEINNEDDIVEIELYNGEFVKSNHLDLIKLYDDRYALINEDIVYFDGNYYLENTITNWGIKLDYRTGSYDYEYNLNYGYINEYNQDYFSEGFYVEETDCYYYDESVLNLHGYEIVDEEIVIKQRVKSEAYIEFEEILESIYPDRWEIKRYNKDIDICYIYFPEITITNSNNNSHIIYDLFVYFKFNNQSLKFKEDLFHGFRTTVSENELKTNYVHSHLGSQDGNFCMGEGAIKYIVLDLYRQYDVNTFEAFLLNLDNYLRWESIEGNPYRYLEKISSLNKIDIEHVVSQFIDYQEFLQKINNLKIVVNPSNLTVLEPDFQNLEELLTEYYKNNITKIIKKDIDTGFYYEIGLTRSSDNLIIPIDKFKDKKLEFKLIKSEDNNKLLNVIHPKYTKYVFTELRQKINRFYFDRINSETQIINQ